jgi:hypothetical protein
MIILNKKTEQIEFRYLKLTLKPRVDRIGWILVFLTLFLYFILPIQWEIDTFLNFPNGAPQPFWVSISQGLAILASIAFGIHQINRHTHLQKRGI